SRLPSDLRWRHDDARGAAPRRVGGGSGRLGGRSGRAAHRRRRARRVHDAGVGRRRRRLGRHGPDFLLTLPPAPGCDRLAGRGAVVVNNAGMSRPCPIAEMDDAALDLHLGVHVRGTVGTTRAAFPVMAAQGGGRIVNTVSGHAFEPKAPNSAAYAAAKGAVFSFTLAAAREGAEHGILVNAIAPLALTPMRSEERRVRERVGRGGGA